ncbi:MAG TPA: MGMT family protein [Candidatus Saccharimonadales bacterium]|nr:MGMT family protein [Candidatus Saccharimonadales bacterium]
MPFAEKVREIIRQVPRGKISTYGTIAALAGSPRSALFVGQILRRSGGDLPWWRIVGKDGFITISNIEVPAELQVELLKSEGVKIKKTKTLYQADYPAYRWQPTDNFGKITPVRG